MKTILIIMILSIRGTSVEHIEFNTKLDCENAKTKTVNEINTVYHGDYLVYCVEK